MSETATERSVDDLRDRLAELCGWERKLSGTNAVSASFRDPYWERPKPTHKTGGVVFVGEFETSMHPFPPNDLTTLAAAWPDGWSWSRHNGLWWSTSPPGDLSVGPTIMDTDTEYEDRLRLTVAVLESMP